MRELAPREAPVYILLGTLHQKMGRVPQALQNFNIAMALDPKEAVAMRANFEAIGQPEREEDGEGDYDYYRGDGGGGDHHHHRNELRGGGGSSDDDEDRQAMLSGTGEEEEDVDEEEEDEMNDLHYADARGM